MIKMWDASAHKCNYTIQAKLEARSCGFAPDGKHFAVGFFNGSVKYLHLFFCLLISLTFMLLKMEKKLQENMIERKNFLLLNIHQVQ
jgi:hypothetical protein